MTWGMVAVAAATVVGSTVNYKSNKDAQKEQQKASDKATAQIEGSTGAARDDINRLFPQAQQSQQQGFQGALDVFGQSLPAQTDVFQQGNVGAQQAILSGLPQIQNALMGNNVDFSQMQPFQIQQPNLGFFQQTLPQIQEQQTGIMGPFQTMPTQESQLTGGQPSGDFKQRLGSSMADTMGKSNEFDRYLTFNKEVLENDPANRLAEKVFKADPVTKGLKKLFSDERLKDNIQKVGTLAGQNIYTWTWKDTEQTKSFAGDSGIGFIAQEVEKNTPSAVSEDKSGYKKIDLSLIFGDK